MRVPGFTLVACMIVATATPASAQTPQTAPAADKSTSQKVESSARSISEKGVK